MFTFRDMLTSWPGSSLETPSSLITLAAMQMNHNHKISYYCYNHININHN